MNNEELDVLKALDDNNTKAATSMSLEEIDAINKMSKNSCMNTDNKCNRICSIP